MKEFSRYLAEEISAEERRKLPVKDLANFDYADYLRQRKAPVGDDYWKKHKGPFKQHFADFQFQTMVKFHQWWREELNKKAGRYVPVACNNGTHRWTKVEEQFDFFNGELNYKRALPDHIYMAMQKSAEMGKFQVVSMPQKGNRKNMEDWEQRIRRSTATAYAAGGIGRVPWDTFMPNNAPRFFGEPEKYADLFGFLRSCKEYLDGYEDAFATGEKITDARWKGESPPLAVRGGSGKVYAFVRTKPGQAEAAVVIHLVEWDTQVLPFQLSIAPSRYFKKRPLRCRLYTPAPYDAAAHQRAWDSKDYEPLRTVTDLTLGRNNAVEIPALDPWGILVIEPASVKIP
jgi:hypothetical protein